MKSVDNYTRTQRFLRPIIRWAVERWFPHHCFWGQEFFRDLEESGHEWKWKSIAFTSAMLIAREVDAQGADYASFTATNCDYDGRSMGDWKITAEKVDCTKLEDDYG